MSTINFLGRGESKPNPWNQAPTETGTPTIHAPKATEAAAASSAELTEDQKSERFVDPLKYAKGGEVAIHGAAQAGMGHPEYAASQQSVDNHPSSIPEAPAQSQEVA
jgi:hypothetical protein